MFSKISDRLVGRRIAAWYRPINPPSIRILNPSHRCQNQSQIISHNASAPSFPNCPHLSCPMANFIGSLSFAYCHTFCGPWTPSVPLVINQQASQQPSVEKYLRRFPSFAPSPSTLSRDTWSPRPFLPSSTIPQCAPSPMHLACMHWPDAKYMLNCSSCTWQCPKGSPESINARRQSSSYKHFKKLIFGLKSQSIFFRSSLTSFFSYWKLSQLFNFCGSSSLVYSTFAHRRHLGHIFWIFCLPHLN